MSDDSDFDEAAHEQLLRTINTGKLPKAKVRKGLDKVNADDLLSSIKTVKSSTADAKKASSLEKKKTKSSTGRTLAAPIHRQARDRIAGAVGFIELKKDVSVWKDVVESNRLAEQIQFPLHEEGVLSVDTAEAKTDSFKPKTELEIEMARLLNNSKHNLNNETVYTEAELEIIKAMNVKEAKERLGIMQKMRALVSYRNAKSQYAGKIKSKGFHRLQKREKRRQLVKEFDDLLARDPEAAKEKLEELQAERVVERAGLRHRAKNKFQQEIIKHASRDPNAKKILEEHLRIGQDLKKKVGVESDSSDEEDGNANPAARMSVADIIKSAALEAAKDDQSSSADGPSISVSEARTHLFEMRAKKRAELAKARMKKDGTVGGESKIFEEESEWTVVGGDGEEKEVEGDDEEEEEESEEGSDDSQDEEEEEEVEEDAKPEKKAVKRKTVDELFAEAEANLVKELQEEAAAIRERERKSAEPPKKKGKKEKKNKKEEEEKAAKEEEEEKKKKQLAVDISLDPRAFLQVETSNLCKVSADLVDKMDEFDQEQERLVAEAFKDDDVVGEFETLKERIEEGERPKDVDLTLQGWGSWAGPGVTEKKKRQAFVLKAKEKRRKDGGKGGVIIKEVAEPTIEKLQPNSLPFPFTRVEDFQAVVSQPIGKDWNPVSVTNNLCKRRVVIQGGRSIRPIDKKEAIKKRMHDSDDDEE